MFFLNLSSPTIKRWSPVPPSYTWVGLCLAHNQQSQVSEKVMWFPPSLVEYKQRMLQSPYRQCRQLWGLHAAGRRAHEEGLNTRLQLHGTRKQPAQTSPNPDPQTRVKTTYCLKLLEITRIRMLMRLFMEFHFHFFIVRNSLQIHRSYLISCVCVCARVHTHVRAQSCLTLWAPVDCSPPGSVEFSQWECWSGVPCPPPGDLPNPGTELVSPALAGGFFTTGPPGKPFDTPSHDK